MGKSDGLHLFRVPVFRKTTVYVCGVRCFCVCVLIGSAESSWAPKYNCIFAPCCRRIAQWAGKHLTLPYSMYIEYLKSSTFRSIVQSELNYMFNSSECWYRFFLSTFLDPIRILFARAVCFPFYIVIDLYGIKVY